MFVTIKRARDDVVLSSWLPVGQEESVVVHKDIRLDFLGTSERFHVINGAALGL